jgi:hypothetical protein
MWNRKTYISLLCLVAISVNPVMAATVPCCCTKRVESKRGEPVRSCCKAEGSKKTERKCRSTRGVKVQLSRQPCGCSVKTAPQPITTKATVFKPGFDVAWLVWLPQQDVLAAMVQYHQHFEPNPDRPSGPLLLALYCRWLN